MAKEPSCDLNHEAMRKELRDKHLSGTRECPACGWMLNPAKDSEPGLTSGMEEEVREIIRSVLVENGLIDAAAEDE